MSVLHARLFGITWFAAWITAPLAPGLSAQAPDTATAAITGVVVDAAGTPVPEALVTLWHRVNRATPQHSRQFSDDQGRFAFVNLPASEAYFVTASRTGFREGAIGQPSVPTDRGSPIVLRTGEWYSKAQVTLTRFGAVTGTVVDHRGEPLVGVHVRAIGKIAMAGQSRLVVGPQARTDDRGWYRLADLPSGAYIIQVPSVTASAPAELSTADLAGGLAALTRAQATGQPPPVEITTALDASWQVQLGQYITPPAPIDGRWRAFPITFFPGTSDVTQATVVDVASDQERVVDIRVMPVATGRISGMVEGPAESLINLPLRLVPSGLEDLGNGSEAATALVRHDGSFVFAGVPAGSYVIDAPLRIHEFNNSILGAWSLPSDFLMPRPMGQSENSWMWTAVESAPAGTGWLSSQARSGAGAVWGRTSIVTTGSDISGVVVKLRAMPSVSGQVVFDPDSRQSPVRPTSVPITLDPADGDPQQGRAEGGARLNAGVLAFSITEAMPGEYFLRAGAFGGWMVRSVSWQGRDITDVPIDLAAVPRATDVTITLTNAVPTLRGSVETERGERADGVAVLAFPAAQDGWRRYGVTPRSIKTTSTSSTGAFEFTTLPAGDYYVVAVPAALRTAWQDPAFLQRMSSVAARVRLSWGETTAQSLRLIGEAR